MVLDGIISTIVGGCAPTQATEVVQEVNSVNPKPLRHGNTEPNSEKSDKCVETKCFLSLMDKDIVRAYGKPYEAFRNETLALRNECSNKTDHRFCPHGSSALPPISVMGLVQPANSVNPKPFRHGNTELNSQQCDKCVENINGRTQVVQDMFRTLWKRSELTGNELVACFGKL